MSKFTYLKDKFETIWLKNRERDSRIFHFCNSSSILLALFLMDPPTSWDSLRKQIYGGWDMFCDPVVTEGDLEVELLGIVYSDLTILYQNQKARKLEAQLDEQMHLYRRFVSNKSGNANDNDLESSIDQLLKQLQQVNSQMQAWVSSGGSEIFSHTLTRHQEILQDLFQEFNRIRSSYRAKKEHASLLEDFREFDRTRLDLEDGSGSHDQALLNERATLHRTTGQMDGVISQAQETIKTLMFQRSTFGGINSKLSNVSSRLPTVNHILSAIKKKKSMDTIILSLVASVCMFLILVYWMTK
ncbi:hypothetical protein MTR67_028091 [Solanum verrucosum]|nr:hypothetical protein MTR67_028091 [Solanum verrucosum]